MKGIREIVSVLEGGKGSGHWSHSGRVGLVGGSTKGKKSRIAFLMDMRDVDEIDIQEFDHFSSTDRKIIGRNFGYAVPGIVKIKAIFDERGRVVAAIQYDLRFATDHVYVQFVTSDVKGGGTRLMAAVCGEAAEIGKGITVEALGQSAKFYAKLGMKQEGQFWYFDRDEAEAFSFIRTRRQR